MSLSKVRNQHNDVEAYLREHGSITQLEAYRVFEAPVTRLSAIIFDLKKKGLDIESEGDVAKNCYGVCRFVRYTLKSPKND